jgi:hypothetical protein
VRIRFAAVLSAAALTLPAFVTGSPVTAAPAGPGFSSPNVEWLAQLPEAGTLGAKFILDKSGKAKWMYVTSVGTGLSIWDVSNPELPIPQGRLPLPHFENEDVDGNENIAIISTSPGGQIFLIDTTNKLAPTLITMLQADDRDAHTSNCVDNCARWMYATEGSYLKAVDLKAARSGDGTVIHKVKYDKYVGGVHDVDQDENGVVWMTGDDGGAAYAIHPMTKGVSKAIQAKTKKATPLNPVNITNMFIKGKNYGRGKDVNDFIMHNSKRPTDAVYKQTKGKSKIAKGGVFLTTEEDYFGDMDGECGGAGRFHTWDASGSVETGAPLRKLDTFELEAGTLDPVKGERQVGTVFCGAHWFTVEKNIVAIGMYGAGTRFLDVSNPRDIKQVGFWFAPDQQTWAAYWVPGSNGIVYTADAERGIDILRYKFGKNAPAVKAPFPVRTKAPKLKFDVRPRSESALGYACLQVVPRKR